MGVTREQYERAKASIMAYALGATTDVPGYVGHLMTLGDALRKDEFYFLAVDTSLKDDALSVLNTIAALGEDNLPGITPLEGPLPNRVTGREGNDGT